MKYLKLIINNKTKRNSDFFDKYELKKILDLYAQMVSNGIWKDYSLNVSKNEISFNIYKRTFNPGTSNINSKYVHSSLNYKI